MELWNIGLHRNVFSDLKPLFQYSIVPFFCSHLSVYVKWDYSRPSMESSSGKYFQIGELASLLELSPRTIRYYEEIGLLNSIKRIEGGKESIRIAILSV